MKSGLKTLGHITLMWCKVRFDILNRVGVARNKALQTARQTADGQTETAAFSNRSF